MNFFFLIFEDTYAVRKVSVNTPTGWCTKACTVRRCNKFIKFFLLDSVIFMLVQLFHQFNFFFFCDLFGFRLESNLRFEDIYILTPKYRPNK